MRDGQTQIIMSNVLNPDDALARDNGLRVGS